MGHAWSAVHARCTQHAVAPRRDAPLLLYLLWLHSLWHQEGVRRYYYTYYGYLCSLWHQEGMRRLVCSYARSGSSVVLLPSTSLPPSSSPAVAPADAAAAPPSPDAPTPTAPPAALAAPTSPGSPRLSASDKGLASDSAQPLELVASRLPSCGGESSGGFSGEVKSASGVKSAERRETPAKGQGLGLGQGQGLG